MIDIIGYIAGILTLLSFSLETILKIRLVNITACIFWIIYGSLIAGYPVIIINSIIIMIHLYYLLKYRNEQLKQK